MIDPGCARGEAGKGLWFVEHAALAGRSEPNGLGTTSSNFHTDSHSLANSFECLLHVQRRTGSIAPPLLGMVGVVGVADSPRRLQVCV